ncbi:MAG: hypothetical protein MUC88_17155, partial [Planctomycetes bacterium]|nr:hypothetical protein [Planctomycetota bacterium]
MRRNGVAHRFVWVVGIMVTAGHAQTVVIGPDAAPRIEYGAQRIVDALGTLGKSATLVRRGELVADGTQVLVVTAAVPEPLVSGKLGPGAAGRSRQLAAQGFQITSADDGAWAAVRGMDDTGTLYGCLELAGRIERAQGIPAKLEVVDAPVMIVRGTCVGMQKTYLLPGRRVYEYPYTPELFPWFYDQAYWKEYLDFLVAHRMNALCIW